VNPALLYLLSRSFWNSVVFRVKRLRKPKYLAGAIMGLLYIHFYFYRFLLMGGYHGARNPAYSTRIPVGSLPEIASLGGAFLFMAFLLLSSWIIPASRVQLYFTEAEIAWLFPGPFRRSTLVAYKLVKSQLSILFAAVLFTIISGRFLLGGAMWLRILSWWMIASTFQMHRIGASFALQRFREKGLADAPRRIALLVGGLAVGTAIYLWARDVRAYPLPQHIDSPETVFAMLKQLLTAGPMKFLLFPFRLMIAPLLTVSTGDFLRTAWPAVLILIAHYAWVVRADGSFEEASIAFSKVRAAFLAARARGERGVRTASKTVRVPLFTLQPRGSALVGFFWKSLLQLGGRDGLRNALIVAACIFAAVAILMRTHAWPTVQIILSSFLIFSSILLLFGPSTQAVTQFRRSTEMMDLLKSYPIAGWQVVGGELLGPMIFGTILQCAGVALFYLVANGLSAELHGLLLPLLPTILATSLLPGFNLVMMIVPCAAGLLLPAWFKTGRLGIEATGMRLLLLIGQLLTFVITLLPAAAVAAALWFIAGYERALPIALPAAGLVLLIEGAAGVLFLGWLFDRFDVSEEGDV